MAMLIKPTHKLTPKLTLNPAGKLDIQILQMPLHKLKELASQQLEENPLLEIENSEDTSQVEEKLDEYLSLCSDGEIPSNVQYDPDAQDRQDSFEQFITLPETLEEHLLHQLHLYLADSLEHKIGEFIIGNIDEDGYLKCSTKDILAATNADTKSINKVFHLIQTFDPSGIAARDLRECLLIQLRSKGQENGLAYKIVDQFLDSLKVKKYSDIAKGLNMPLELIKEASKDIAALQPNPGRSFSAEKSISLIPDAQLIKNDEGYEIVMNNKALPGITINNSYKQMIKQKDTPGDAREYLRQRINSARSFISSLKRRQQTIQEVIEAIVAVQKDYLDEGVDDLKPMTFQDIAEAIGKDKSTVSRAINNKYLETSWGIIELRYFFNSGIKQDGKIDISSQSIKLKITELIDDEDKDKPLSDQNIVDRLNQDGIFVSRRAVTKYRKQLQILSSQLRRR